MAKKPLGFAVFTAGRAVGYNCIADKRTFGSDDPAVSILRAVSVSNRRGQIGWPWWGVITAFCLGSLVNTAVALEVVRVQFGFAGQFIPEEFNIVNVEIQNRDSVAWQGNLVLSRAVSMWLIFCFHCTVGCGRRQRASSSSFGDHRKVPSERCYPIFLPKQCTY